MRLTSIRPGDIVRVDDGLPYLAFVRECAPRQLHVAAITGPRGYRTITARQVVEHWRAARSKDSER
jgi:hypothetical protein